MNVDLVELQNLIWGIHGRREGRREKLSLNDTIVASHREYRQDPIRRWGNDFWGCYRHQNIEVLKYQLEHRPDGVSVDVPLGGYRGRSMFFNCCDSNRSKKFLQLLLQHGSNGLNEVDEKGNTALDVASRNGHRSIVRFLVQSGADYTRSNRKGYFPFHQAIRSGRVSLVQFWLDRSPESFYAPLANGNTPFHLAAKSTNSRAMIEVLMRFAKISVTEWINLPNQKGDSPFTLAVGTSHCPTIEFLLFLGGKITFDGAEEMLGEYPWPIIEMMVACSEIEVACISESKRLEIRHTVYFSSSLTQRLVLELDTI